MAYAMCSHLVIGSKLFDRPLCGTLGARGYVYRSKRGAKPKANPDHQYLLTQPIEQPADDIQEPASKRVRVEPVPNVPKTRGRPKIIKETVPKRKRAQPKATQALKD